MRTISGDLSASEIIALLAMLPHPEGGHYVETYRDPTGPQGRGHSTAIYFLLQVGEVSAWHRVDAAEHWFWHAGGPLALSISEDGQSAGAIRLGPDLRAGQRPQAVVPVSSHLGFYLSGLSWRTGIGFRGGGEQNTVSTNQPPFNLFNPTC
jgi:uncharacterized protein